MPSDIRLGVSPRIDDLLTVREMRVCDVALAGVMAIGDTPPQSAGGLQ
jgi:hypothetical protein